MRVPIRFMRKNRILHDVQRTGGTKFSKAKPGDVIDIVVYDGFSAKATLIKKAWRKYFVELTDISMCYHCQEQLPDGTKMWFSKKEITDDDRYRTSWREKMYNIKCFFFPKFKIEEKDELPF